jgi:hypothetical protein
MKRYAWLGETRKRALGEVVSSCFDAWLPDWCLQHDTSEATIAEIPLVSCQADKHVVWTAEVAGGHLLALLDRNRLEAFGGRLVLADAEKGDAMAIELASAAMQDLIGRLVARADPACASPVSRTEVWPTSIRPEWGGLGFQITFEGFALLVGMDRPVADLLCPERAGNPGVLSNRAESLGSLTVGLTAVLDFGAVNARDLAGLRVGEVLVGERSIAQPVALRAGPRHVFDASIARIDGQFAVVAVAPPTGEVP